MRLFLNRLFGASMYLAGLFMIGTLLAVLLSIFGRIIPMLNVPGTDAYAGYCMAASAFLALASTLRRGEHIRVTLIINRLSPTAHHWLDVFCHAVALIIASALAWYSIQVVRQSFAFHDVSSSMDATPLWIPQMGMAFGTTVFALAFVVDLVDLLAGRANEMKPTDGEPARIE